MTRPGGAPRHTIQIDSKTYYLAEDSSGDPIYETVALGRDLKESWDFQQPSYGMGETTRQTPTGYYFTQNIEYTRRGLRMRPKVNTVALASGDLPSGTTGVFWETRDAGLNRRMYFAAAKSATAVRVTKIDFYIRNSILSHKKVVLR